MGITRSDHDLHRAGNRDSSRHKEKLKDAFRKKLTDIISEENIITSEKGKKVRVPIRALDNYRFVFDPKKQEHVGQGDGETQEGDVLDREEKGDQQSQPGDGEGAEYYEAEIDLEELIEMMLEDLRLPLLDPKKHHNLKEDELRYEDIARKGSMSALDKKRTLIENIKRNTRQGRESRVAHINEEDLRFRTWVEKFRPVTSAVVIACLDVSASMDTDKRYVARSFLFWMVNFLRQKYQEVEIVFIAHTSVAKECDEYEFFHRNESGGTKVSSAYELAEKIIEDRFNPDLWNIYTFHFSDGDTFGDEDECVRRIRSLCEVCSMVGYAEISPYFNNEIIGTGWEYSTLYKHYSKTLTDLPNFYSQQLRDKGDILVALRQFFSGELDDK